MRTLIMEWRHTYRSARRDGFNRLPAGRMFAREVLAGWCLSLGLHPRYDRNGLLRRR